MIVSLAKQIATLFYAVRGRRELADDCDQHGNKAEAERHRAARRDYARSLRNVVKRPGGRQALELYRGWERDCV